MARKRKPIPGWDEMAVFRWIVSNDGTANKCVSELLPDLRGPVLRRAVSRVNVMRKRIDDRGRNTVEAEIRERFPGASKPERKQPARKPKRGSLHVLPPPPQSEPQSTTPVSESEAKSQPPESPPAGPAVDRMTPSQMLSWTIQKSAAWVEANDGRTSIAPTLKYIRETHAVLMEVREVEGEEEMSLEQLADFISRNADSLPNEILDRFTAAFLRKNPKWTLALKSKVSA